MRIGEEIGLDPGEKHDLYYALLLKDAGCSCNASKLFHLLGGDEIRAKREVRTTDWTYAGWDSLQYALRNVRVDSPIAAESLHRRGALFPDPESPVVKAELTTYETSEQEMEMTEAVLDNVCEAFAEIIDAKSPYTYLHSAGVANAAVSVASGLGLDIQTVRTIRRAALLHDIGKLSVPNSILEKPQALSAAEWEVVKCHPYYTMEILRRVRGFAEISEIAASHHEKLDGSGYFRHMNASNLSLPARILVVADIYDALSAKRPYRDSLDFDSVLTIMRKDAPRALDVDCVEALARVPQPASSQRIEGSLAA